MDDLKYIITVLTVSFIIYGLILVFTPAGNMGKFFKSIVGVSLIAVVILTVSRQGIELNPKKAAEAERIEFDVSAVETITAQYSERSVEEYIGELLRQNGCEYKNLEVYTNISSDGGISIDRVEISCDSQQSDTVRRLVNALSLHCVITETDNDGL